MKILLVNDDGINAPGLEILEKQLAEDDHEVWVCAPSGQRSASSHAVTLRRQISIEKLSDRHYSCDGYPADCVLFALQGAVPSGKPDAIISGINNGYNIGTDLLYSGTAGAACEGASRGIPSFAVSAAYEGEDFEVPYEAASRFITCELETFVRLCPPQSYININVPFLSDGRTWGVAALDYMVYGDYLVSHGEQKYSIEGKAVPGVSEVRKETDYDFVENNVIAVSCIHVLPQLDEKGQERLRRCIEAEETDLH